MVNAPRERRERRDEIEWNYLRYDLIILSKESRMLKLPNSHSSPCLPQSVCVPLVRFCLRLSGWGEGAMPCLEGVAVV